MTMSKFFVLVFIYLSRSSALPPVSRKVIDSSQDWRVMGGSDAEPGAYPYIVSLRVGNRHYCGGSILNNRWIITAGHCAEDTSVNQSKVVAGSNTLDSGGDRYNISEIFIHPNFTMEWLQNDIALLRLSSQIQFSKNVSALNLPSTNVGVGEKVVAAGWGVYRIPRDVPNNLQHINLTTISVSKCQKTMPVTDTQVCTFTKKGEGICYGDSGGPLVSAGHILQGIVSFGIPCAAGYPDVYSRVYSFLSWIDETIKTDNVTITTI